MLRVGLWADMGGPALSLGLPGMGLEAGMAEGTWFKLAPLRPSQTLEYMLTIYLWHIWG